MSRFLLEQMAHVDVMGGPCTEDLGHSCGVWSSDLAEGRWTAGLQGAGAFGLCCPSYNNGCIAKAGAGGDLESPEKPLARKETVNILLELLDACDSAG